MQRFLLLLILFLTLPFVMNCQAAESNTFSPFAEQHYLKLKAEWERLQEEASWSPLWFTRLLKPGMKRPEVAALRQRLAQTHDDIPMPATDVPIDPNYFDDTLAAAVKSFQARYGLKADGMVGAATLDALNVTREERIEQLAVNLGRWASLRDQIPNRFIFVNVPDYQMTLYDNDQPVLTMKTIVGKPQRQTPEIYSEITRIIFNPYWHVPTKIARRDILPKVQENPAYLRENHIKVFRRVGDSKQAINDYSVDWDQEVPQNLNFDFRQDPGVKNSLGIVKFEFPNDYDVYMHDTPAKNLFESFPRDFSSGCIRLEDAMALVNYLIKQEANWNPERVEAILETQETTDLKVSHPLPVIITYITAWVDQAGQLNFREDIYHRDGGISEE